MRLLRLARLCLHLVYGLLVCAVVFPWIGMPRRARRIGHWSRQLVAICGVKVDLRMLQGLEPAERALIVANHVSWLDIFVINTVQPCRFVAKSDIRNWPLIGWLCDKAGTIFIARGRVRDVRRIFEHLVEALHDGEHVAFFPEGSVASPGVLLPFHANLFEAAIDARVPVQPYALQYVDTKGRLHPAADFSGSIGFLKSAMMIAGARGMTAQLTLLPAISTEGAHRRELANVARSAIAEILLPDSRRPAAANA
jgi:1-acyl-sn-glycerol-3-phosphate acyltransferase